MVAKTIHITDEQGEWIDEMSLNVSKYVRKLIDTEMFVKNN